MEIHNNEKLVRWSPEGLGENVILPTMLHLFAYLSNQDAKDQLTCHICERPFWQMAVHVSPIYTLLVSQKEWVPRYVSSFETIMKLQSLLWCHTTCTGIPFYDANGKLCDKMKVQLQNFTSQLELWFYAQVGQCQNRVQMKKCVIEYTYRFINMMERCVFELFLKGRCDVKEDACLTPRCDLDLFDRLDENAQKRFRFDQEVFFKTKEQLLKLDARELPEEDAEKIPTNIFTFTPNCDLYKEYFDFCKLKISTETKLKNNKEDVQD